MAQFRAAAPTAPRALLLHGRVVTMDAARTVTDDGVVGIVGTDIVHVAPRAAPRPPELAGGIEVTKRVKNPAYLIGRSEA